MNLRPYPKYKESGEPWLGSVPDHWEIRPSKSVFGLRNEAEKIGDEHLTPSQSLGVLPQSEYMRRTGNKVVLALAGTTMKHVEKDDFVIHLRSFQGGIEWSGFAGKVSPAYTVIFPYPAAVPAYFRHLLKSKGYIETIASLTDQLRDGQSMRYYDFGKTPLPLPPAWEQQAIANYLDFETAEIDGFIADQEQLIKLLKERRAATVTRAVTKGLNRNAPTKDSGVEWFGTIPADWEMTRIKHVGTTHIGLTYAPEDVVDGPENGTLVLRSGNVQDGRIDLSSCVYVKKVIPPSLRTQVGDILICARNGSRSLIGKNAVIGNESVGQTFGAFMTVLRSQDSDYLYWVLNSSLFKAQMGLFVTATINQLTNATLNNFEIPMPPLNERILISDYLRKETAQIDAAVADAREAIALSKERRVAVVTAAVTGKIDVRSGAMTERARPQGEPVGVA